jgi:membrane protease YdiL (CAAX protease family)
MVRTPWRLVLFLVVTSIATFVVGGLVYGSIGLMAGWLGQRPILYPWVGAAGLLIAHQVCLRRIDKLPWHVAGLGEEDARPSLLVRGAVLGALAIGVPSLVLWASGWLRLDTGPAGSTVSEGVRSFVILAPAAFAEELAVRGYLLAVLRSVMDWRIAVVGTSVFFGLLHGLNPGASVWPIAVVVLAGIMLGTIVVVTGSLYAATAAHLAWNWIMAAVLHVPVSGLTFATPDYRLVDAGPDWATGGAWGPEGGAGAVLGMSIALLYLYTRRARSRED